MILKADSRYVHSGDNGDISMILSRDPYVVRRDGVSVNNASWVCQPGGVRAHRTSPERPPHTGLLEGCTPWGVRVAHFVGCELKSSRVVGSSITLEAGGKWRPCRVPGLASWGSQSAQWHWTPCWGVACTGVVAGWFRCMEFVHAT